MPKGSRGGKGSKIPQGMSREIYERYKSDGFTDADIVRIHAETAIQRELMVKRAEKVAREGPREIVSGTYLRERARNRKQAELWMARSEALRRSW